MDFDQLNFVAQSLFEGKSVSHARLGSASNEFTPR